MSEKEKYFVASFDDGSLEAVEWFETIKDARRELNYRKESYPNEEHFMGEKIVEEMSKEHIHEWYPVKVAISHVNNYFFIQYSCIAEDSCPKEIIEALEVIEV